MTQLEDALDLLAGKFNDSIMTGLNYRSDYLNQTPEKIASDFLIENKLYKEPQNGNSGTVRIGSKIFGEQYILAQMYRFLISGNTDLKVETKTGLGGTKICFDALTNNQIDFYPEYTGTALLVLLKTDAEVIEKLDGNKDAVYQYVKDKMSRDLQLDWLKPIGFNNSYALMMRREQAQSLHIKTISDLTNHLN